VFPSNLTPAALRVLAVITEAGIPCIYFFDQARYKNPTKLATKEAGLICLPYYLIRRLVNQLPSNFETEQNFNEEQFSKLDRTMNSVGSALELIRALLGHAQNSMVFIINGIRARESKTARSALEDVVEIIRQRSSKTAIKVIFTTDGMPQILGEKVKSRERVDASRLVQARLGGLLRGSSSLSDLEFGLKQDVLYRYSLGCVSKGRDRVFQLSSSRGACIESTR
jgi:hypothetical protein